MKLRLQGPLSAIGIGRVEVSYYGYWGTICDPRWDMRDARVVYRQLGYQDVARILQRNEVPSGSGPIWIWSTPLALEKSKILYRLFSSWLGGTFLPSFSRRWRRM